MLKHLIQIQWIRNLFPNTTYIFVENKWKSFDNFIKGEKVEDVDGLWNTKFFCTCKNELIQSESILDIRYRDEATIYIFKCSHCNQVIYGRPDLGTGIIPCDKYGNA